MSPEGTALITFCGFDIITSAFQSEFHPDAVSVEFLNQKDQIAFFSFNIAKLFFQLGLKTELKNGVHWKYDGGIQCVLVI